MSLVNVIQQISDIMELFLLAHIFCKQTNLACRLQVTIFFVVNSVPGALPSYCLPYIDEDGALPQKYSL